MSILILSSKLQKPPLRPERVQRPRLITQLNNGLHRKLTLISAPAGFGKTTITRSWLAESEHPVAWLSLDKRDNDSTRFLAHLIAAIQTIDADVGQWVSDALQSGQQLSVEAVFTSLLNEIAVIPNDFWLVLDDYHLLEAPEIDAGLEFFLDHLPPQMHLVIITREDPQLPLWRLRVRDQLTELRVADLRFTSDEAVAFLNQAMGLTLSAADIDALEKRTEGWIAGLQLAALSLHGRTDVTDFIQAFTGSHRFVVDYLLEEVLLQQAEPIREFLLYTSILDYLHGSLCDAVIESNNSQNTLEYLERNNLFMIALDDERGWYRYHHLFGDALRNALKSDHPDIIASLHQRASHWYVEHKQFPESIRHALLTDDLQLAADLIETVWPQMDWNYQSGAWFEWASQLPEAIVVQRPILCLGYSWVKMMRGDLETAEKWLQKAEYWLDTDVETQQQMRVIDPLQFKELPASIAHGRAYRALALGDISTAGQLAQQAIDLIHDREHVTYGRGLVLNGLALLANGDLVAADQKLSDFTAQMEAAENVFDGTELAFTVGDIRLTLGRLHDAEAVYQNAFRFLMRQGDPFVIGREDLHRGLADVYLALNQLMLAEEHILTAEELGEQGIMRPNWLSRLYGTQAQLKIAQGDLEAALPLLDEAEQHYLPNPIFLNRSVAAVRARVWIQLDQIDAAQRWANQQKLSPDGDITYIHEYDYLTLARLQLATYQQQPSDKLKTTTYDLLERLQATAQAGGRLAHVIEALIFRALLDDTLDDTASALKNLQHALQLAQPESYLRPFLDEGERVRKLLRQAVTQKELSDDAHWALNAFTAPASALPPTQDLIDPLSERELDVLRLLNSELTGPEIARHLIVSLSTMRTHTRNIYSKLGVNSRRAAVRRAKELALL